jgi:branched-chain amino acid transport system substrate-binding protein
MGVAFLFFLALPGLAVGLPPVRIGTLLDLGGATRDLGKETLAIAELAVGVINAHGGVAGRRVELVSFDTRGVPALGPHGARELISHRNVMAVLGPADWATAAMTKPFFREAQVPVMMLAWDDSVIRRETYGTYEWIFRLPLTRRTVLERIGVFLAEKGWRRVGLVIESDAPGREAKDWFRSWGHIYGIEVLSVESLTPTDDIRAKLVPFANQNPQAVVSWCSVELAATVAQVLRRLGVTVPLFQSHEISPQGYVGMAGPAAGKSLIVSNKMLVWEDLEDHDPQKRTIQDFFERIRNVYGYGQSDGVEPFSGYVWDSVMILARALREAGASGDRLRDTIERIHRHVGVGGVYGFNHLDHNGLAPDSMVVVEVDRVQGDRNRWAGAWRMAK